jgi:hypothetical protein
LFVEGDDFQILSRFARKLGLTSIANRSDFAVVPVKGFNPERIRSLKNGMEMWLIPLSQVNQNLGLAGQIRNWAEFGRS